MIQYSSYNNTKIKNKEGKDVLINKMRDRIEYPLDGLIQERANKDDIKRPDLRVSDTYGSFAFIGVLIDSNDKDIFSFDFDDTIYYPIRELVVG
jgi:hypothetical protein